MTLKVIASEGIFEQPYNESLIHQVLIAYQANARSATARQKTRSQVRGGGRKPWNQKGTGRARAGTIRSPIWRGGGKAHAAQAGRNYKQKVNKKMYTAAMCSILSELKREGRLLSVDKFVVDAPKTKLVVELLKKHSLENVLIVATEVDKNLHLAVNNLPHVEVIDVAGVDPVSLISFDNVVLTKDAEKQLGEMLA